MNEFALRLPAPSPTLMTHVASPVALNRAWRKVRANHGAAGVDAVSVREFERHLDANLSELGRTLASGSYQPLPPRIVNASKSSGALRQLAIPCVRDRVAQRAVLDAIEPLFEPNFSDCSFAFRPGRSVEMAVQSIAVARANGFQWTLESDVADFFPSIDHQQLLRDVGECVSDASLLRVVSQWLAAGVLTDATVGGLSFGGIQTAVASAGLVASNASDELIEEWVSERLPSDAMPSGGSYYADGDDLDAPGRDAMVTSTRRRSAVRRLVESGILLTLVERAVLRRLLNPSWLGAAGAGLAAVALAPAAVRMIRSLTQSRRGAAQGSPISPLLSNIYLHPFDVAISASGSRLARYCDDFVIMCRTESEVRSALAAAKSALGSRHLSMRADKTRIIAPGGQYTFLGYQFGPGNLVVAPPTLSTTTRRALARALRQCSTRLES